MNTAILAFRGRLYRVWDQASIYLPVVLIGILAMGSYWAVQNTPPALRAPTPTTASQEPDYFMRDFHVRTYDPTGALKNEVQGTEARHYPGPDTLEVDRARIRSISPSGQLTTAKADRVSTNSDQSDYVLQGNAVVVRESRALTSKETRPRVEFQGEYLRIRTNLDRVESHLPVLLIRGQDRVTADEMVYEDRTRVADLKGGVKAVLAARRLATP
jgi:lipopolysaccharide export system protein LptC